MQSNRELEARIEKLEQLVANIDKRLGLAGNVLAAAGRQMQNYATVLQTHQEQLEKLSITLKDPGATKLAN
jgi:uncharacterized coiled-coil protein SlyX